MHVDLGEPSGTRVDESMRLVGRDDHDVARPPNPFLDAVGERRLSFDHEEELRVGVLVKPRPLTWLRVDEITDAPSPL